MELVHCTVLVQLRLRAVNAAAEVHEAIDSSVSARKKILGDLALLRNLIITHIESVYRICKLPLFSNIYAAAGGGVMPQACKRPSKHTFEDESRPLQVIYGGASVCDFAH